MSIKIIYNSPAMPQGDYNFALNKVYECKKVKDKYVVANKEYSLAFLKSMFKPCEDYSWDMLEEKKDTEENATKKINKVAKPIKNK